MQPPQLMHRCPSRAYVALATIIDTGLTNQPTRCTSTSNLSECQTVSSHNLKPVIPKSVKAFIDDLELTEAA